MLPFDFWPVGPLKTIRSSYRRHIVNSCEWPDNGTELKCFRVFPKSGPAFCNALQARKVRMKGTAQFQFLMAWPTYKLMEWEKSIWSPVWNDRRASSSYEAYPGWNSKLGTLLPHSERPPATQTQSRHCTTQRVIDHIFRNFPNSTSSTSKATATPLLQRSFPASQYVTTILVLNVVCQSGSGNQNTHRKRPGGIVLISGGCPHGHSIYTPCHSLNYALHIPTSRSHRHAASWGLDECCLRARLTAIDECQSFRWQPIAELGH